MQYANYKMTYGRPISDASSAITFASHSLPCHGNDGWYKWANYEGADTHIVIQPWMKDGWSMTPNKYEKEMRRELIA